MSTPPAGMPAGNWSSWPAGARQLILAQPEAIQALRRENDELRDQLTALATELASLRERIGRHSRNAFKPPSSDGPGLKPPERRKGSGRKPVGLSGDNEVGKPGHPGSGPEPLPIERVDSGRGAIAVGQNGRHLQKVAACGCWPLDVPGDQGH